MIPTKTGCTILHDGTLNRSILFTRNLEFDVLSDVGNCICILDSDYRNRSKRSELTEFLKRK